MAHLLTYRINPHHVLAFHAKFPIQHEFISTHINESLCVTHESSWQFTCQNISFWDGKDTFVIAIYYMHMRSVVATVLFGVHVHNHS